MTWRNRETSGLQNAYPPRSPNACQRASPKEINEVSRVRRAGGRLAIVLTPLQWREWLIVLLSTIAGLVDVISFLTLKIFAAHVTGNLVLIAPVLVGGRSPRLDQDLAVPVFVVAT